MMRKDVKIGFAIGGVLLAVLIVYVLVISGGDDKSKDVSLVTSDSQSSQTDNAGNKPSGDEKSSTSEKKHRSDTPAPPTSASHDDPFKNPGPSLDHGATESPKPVANNGDDKWAAALNTGKLAQLPVMMTKTPDPTTMPPPSSSAPTVAEANKLAAPANSGSVSTTLTPPIVASNAPVTVGGSSTDLEPPTSQPVKGMKAGASADQPGKHTVQPGETYSSIAASVYGSSAYWPHITRANPTIDARKLKAGMVINLPPASEVKADSKTTEQSSGTASGAAESGGASKPIDTKTEYRVVAGDSLYKISMKLYGKGTLSDKIYELNKSTIGENPAHLKLGMILKLPEAPTATASR